MRRWINILAVFAVLLHAGALVRHHSVMLDAQAQHQTLLADLAVICHSNGSTERLAASDLPAVPQPTDAQNSCPLCAGLTTAFAVAAYVAVASAPIAYAKAEPFRLVQFVASDLTTTRHPPSRGPPLSA
jgi:hypothetical protein